MKLLCLRENTHFHRRDREWLKNWEYSDSGASVFEDQFHSATTLNNILYKKDGCFLTRNVIFKGDPHSKRSWLDWQIQTFYCAEFSKILRKRGSHRVAKKKCASSPVCFADFVVIVKLLARSIFEAQNILKADRWIYEKTRQSRHNMACCSFPCMACYQSAS